MAASDMPSKTKVIFNLANLKQCLCDRCPVQEKSQCAKEKLKAMEDVVAKGDAPKKDIPKLYCATGATPCRDMDFDQECICGNCTIWYKYLLAKENPKCCYCQLGRVK